MGMVYEAVDDTIERRVAIKVLTAHYAKNPDITARFFNEARAANRIDHPSIVKIFEHNQLPDGAAYLVMELLNGESLASRIRREEQIPAHVVAQLGWQIATGLAAAHKHRIVHRDLKPANIMLVADPIAPGGERVKLLDFGIAKLTEGTKNPTQSNVIMGTPTYMSPEQCKGAGGVDERSDVYSLGVVLFEMLAGRPPFISDGGGEIIGMHLFAPLPDLAQLSPQSSGPLVALVTSLLAKDRKLRPAMADVAAVLAELRMDRSSAPTLMQPPVVRSRPSSGRYRMVPLFAALLGIVGFGGWYLREPHRSPPSPRLLQTEQPVATAALAVPRVPVPAPSRLSMAEAVQRRETIVAAPEQLRSEPLPQSPQPLPPVEFAKSPPAPPLTPESSPAFKKPARVLPKEPGLAASAHRVTTTQQQRPTDKTPERTTASDELFEILEVRPSRTTSVRPPELTVTPALAQPLVPSTARPVEPPKERSNLLALPPAINRGPKPLRHPVRDQ